MAAGLSPDLTVASGEGRGLRQLHAVDRHGRTAAWTGANCVTWCGAVADHAVGVAGNMLANASVVPATLAAVIATVLIYHAPGTDPHQLGRARPIAARNAVKLIGLVRWAEKPASRVSRRSDSLP